MAEIITCPNCQRQLQVPETFFGQLVQCPDCAHQFTAAPPANAVQSKPPSSIPPAKSGAGTRGKPAASDAYDHEPSEEPRRRRRDDDAEDEFDDDLRISRGRQYQQPHRASLVLVMGILAICCVAPIITGTIAWILGHNDLKEMDAGSMDPSGRGQTQTGKTLGMIGVIINVVLFLGYCFIMIIAGIGGAMGPRRRR